VLASLDSLTSAERAAALDVGQLTLDVVGIFEPTPFADLTSAVISLCRGDVSSAAMSGISVIPYAGDVAKLARIPRYVASVDSALALARSSPRFGGILSPLLARLLNALGRLPLSRLSPPVRDAVMRIDRAIRDFLPESMWALSRRDRLAEDMLKQIFGSARHVGFLQRQNMRVIVDFLDRHGYAAGNTAEWAAKIKGLDLHAADAIGVTQLRTGDRVAMYVDTARPPDRQVGEWLVKSQGAVGTASLGISGAGRSRQLFRVKAPVEVLESRAAHVADTWTTGRRADVRVVTTQNDRQGLRAAELAGGGGTQYFLPRAWEFLEKL
jgi:hypothetical protein